MSIRPRRLIIAAVGALASGALMVGCAAPTATGTQSTDKAGGSLVYLDAELSSNTQLQSSGTWQDSGYITNITDRLIYRDPATGELLPYIASDWTVSDDGLVYTFEIVDGVTYSDGTPLDAASVQRNLEWQAYGDEEKGIPADNWFPEVASVTSDEAAQTVTVTLTAPYAPFLNVLSFWRTSLVADATIDATLEAQSQITGIIGSGPFVVESEKYGEEIVFAKRSGYDWAPPSLEHQGEAYLDEIVVIPVTEDSVRLGSLKSGESDLIRYIQPSEEAGLEAAGITVVGIQGAGNVNIWDVRQSAPFVDDINVRRALQHGIDRQQIIDDLYTENWQVATSTVTPTTFGYVDLSAELVYDPDESNRLLDEAGWTEVDADGYRTKDGERLHLLTYVDVFDSTAKPLFQLVQWQLKKLGIELEIKETDYANYSTILANPDVAVRRNGWPEADAWVRQNVNYNSTQSNLYGFAQADETLDGLYAAQAVATSDQERAEIVGEIQRHVIDQAYGLPIIDDTQVFGIQPHIHDFGTTYEARPWFYDTWTEKK
ncbi:ABC transporter substrate-binding protein [Microbacterium invictum]|uniref:Peptide/nickel transport system substrate-binding protein n=1 Tax=Microbacterium invictum TaxID=515415 RepID=A0AA40SPD0_9MICO|nr:MULTISPECIES: ABC transporter substrate-binding protein [Microbacterium]MBB4139955.1 peptide/nickel transport system substrate-binding protein [Microbacterium invictum]